MAYAMILRSPNDLGFAAVQHFLALAPTLSGSWRATMDYDEEGDRYVTLSPADGQDAFMVCRVNGVLSVIHTARDNAGLMTFDPHLCDSIDAAKRRLIEITARRGALPVALDEAA